MAIILALTKTKKMLLNLKNENVSGIDDKSLEIDIFLNLNSRDWSDSCFKNIPDTIQIL